MHDVISFMVCEKSHYLEMEQFREKVIMKHYFEIGIARSKFDNMNSATGGDISMTSFPVCENIWLTRKWY